MKKRGVPVRTEIDNVCAKLVIGPVNNSACLDKLQLHPVSENERIAALIEYSKYKPTLPKRE